MDDVQPTAEAPAEPQPPKKESLVAKMLRLGEEMLKRRAAKREERAKAKVELPWWKRRATLIGRVLHAVAPSGRNQRRAQAKRAEAFMPSSKDARDPMTKAERKRRNRAAREHKGSLITLPQVRPRTAARAERKRLAKAERQRMREAAR